jgi:hypothetical protein
VTPAPAIANESVRLSGGLASQVARPVVLQRLSGGSWVKVASGRSTSTGRFAFTRSAPGTSSTWRVVAPRTTVGGRALSAVTTPQRTLSITSQKVVLTMDTSLTTGESTLATATATPARPNRYVDFQLLEGSTWQLFDTSKEGTGGKALTRLGFDGPGTYTLRAVARAANGAPAKASAPVTVTAEPPPLPRLYRVSRTTTGGTSANGARLIEMSLDGRRVLWSKHHNGDGPLSIFDRETRLYTDLSKPSGFSGATASTASGNLRYVVLTVPRGSGLDELFVWDRQSGAVTSLSLDTQGSYEPAYSSSPSISDNGRYVAFTSTANHLVPQDPNPIGDDVFVRDLVAGTTTVLTGTNYDATWQESSDVRISGDGSTVIYLTSGGNLEPGLGHLPVHAVWHRATGTTEVVRVGTRAGAVDPNLPAHPLSADGGKAFLSLADAQGSKDYVVALGAGADLEVPEVPSPAGDGSTLPLSPDGISGDGTTLTGNVADLRYPGPVEVGDLYTWTVGGPAPLKVTKRASDGSWSRGSSRAGHLSADGHWLAFASDAEDLVAGDSDQNALPDVFLWDALG